MKRGRKIMQWVIGVLVVIILGIVIWFSIPWSPMKAEFAGLKSGQNAPLSSTGEVFTKEDIAGLPAPLQRYFEVCGYLGKPKMFNIKMTHSDVNFILSSSMPTLKIKSTQYNSADKPERVALLETRLYGIPFEGIDAYEGGEGSMKGVIAKAKVLFDQRGAAMNQSSLVNCLAESLFVPSIVLRDFMSWEAIDKSRVKGTISYYGMSVSGMFTFDENGYFTDFTTEDRVYVDTAGNERQVSWSALCGDYRDVGGIMQPKSLKAVWHLPEGDLVYFDGHNTVIEYDVTG